MHRDENLPKLSHISPSEIFAFENWYLQNITINDRL